MPTDEIQALVARQRDGFALQGDFYRDGGIYAEEVQRIFMRSWLYALRRRSQRDRTTWAEITRLAEHWLPKPTVRHPWPDRRFDAKYAR